MNNHLPGFKADNKGIEVQRNHAAALAGLVRACELWAELGHLPPSIAEALAAVHAIEPTLAETIAPLGAGAARRWWLMPRFTAGDVEAASEAWGLNCGPAAFAATLDLTLDETRKHFGPEFEAKRYTDPTLMLAALRSAMGEPGTRWRVLPGSRAYAATVGWPTYGLCRSSGRGGGPSPAFPIAARYRKTHWIGLAKRSTGAISYDSNVGIWDVNALANGSGWCSLGDWSSKLVPWILESYPGANGGWHITHSIEVAPMIAKDRGAVKRAKRAPAA